VHEVGSAYKTRAYFVEMFWKYVHVFVLAKLLFQVVISCALVLGW